MRTLAGIILALTLGAVGAHASISISDGLTRDFHLCPGEVKEGIIEVRNSSDEPQRVRLYQTDYLFFADGSNHYDDPGTTVRSNADWIVFSPQEVEIAPRGTAQVLFRITVPQDETLVGTYWSMLMAEPVPDVPDPEMDTGTPAVGVRMVIRHGIQISVTIDGEGEKMVQPHGNLEKLAEGTFLHLDLDNTGEFLVRPAVWAEIYNAGGELTERQTSDPLRIYPGCSVRHKFGLELAPGAYQALVVIDNGGGEVWGTQYNLEID